MASKVVEDAISAHLVANWNLCPIFTENMQGEAPTDGTPFIILQFPLARVERMAVNQRTYREFGGFRIVINVERGEGTAKIRLWGETLATLFRDRKIGPVNCLVPTEPFTDDSSDRGNYFMGSMVCEFWRTFKEA